MNAAINIAMGLIDLAYENENPVSNLKLQKLLYYSQAWHLAIFKHPLFNEEIEAWVHGPVVPEVFRMYRHNKWASIPRSGSSSISGATKSHLEEVWHVYGSLSAYDLERLTHSEEPWQDARVGIDSDVSCHVIITKDSMLTYYSLRLNGQS